MDFRILQFTHGSLFSPNLKAFLAALIILAYQNKILILTHTISFSLAYQILLLAQLLCCSLFYNKHHIFYPCVPNLTSIYTCCYSLSSFAARHFVLLVSSRPAASFTCATLVVTRTGISICICTCTSDFRLHYCTPIYTHSHLFGVTLCYSCTYICTTNSYY